MDAIHINWTKPARIKSADEYEIEDFELLTTILSALKWQEKNGKIKMVTDFVGAEYYRKIGIDGIWNEIDVCLDDTGVCGDVFWAAGKIFALKRQQAPTAVIDTDFIVWEKIDEKTLGDLNVIHREAIDDAIYPSADFFNADGFDFDKFNWSVEPSNTAFYIIKNQELLDYYTETAIAFMKSCKEKNDRLAYMVFAEQRLISMCADKLSVEIKSFSSLDKLFGGKDNRFTHIWGMKQQMRENYKLRKMFCQKCVRRILKDFPKMADTLYSIDRLKEYFDYSS